MSFLFNGFSSLKQIEFVSFETTQVTNIREMFQDCNELEFLDLSKFNTGKIIEMDYTFYRCNKLKEIKGINNFNTSNVTNMQEMFMEWKELENLDLTNFSKYENKSKKIYYKYEIKAKYVLTTSRVDLIDNAIQIYKTQRKTNKFWKSVFFYLLGVTMNKCWLSYINWKWK